MKSFSKDLVDRLSVADDEYRIGFLRYSSYANRQFDLREHIKNPRTMKRAIDNIAYRPGGTNTERALDYVRTNMLIPQRGERDFARNHVLLLTGQDKSLNTNNAWRAAERLEDSGTGLFVIGMEIGDRTELDELASHPLSTYQFLTRRRSDLDEIPGLIDARLKGSKNSFMDKIHVVTVIPRFLNYVYNRFNNLYEARVSCLRTKLNILICLCLLQFYFYYEVVFVIISIFFKI